MHYQENAKGNNCGCKEICHIIRSSPCAVLPCLTIRPQYVSMSVAPPYYPIVGQSWCFEQLHLCFYSRHTLTTYVHLHTHTHTHTHTHAHTHTHTHTHTHSRQTVAHTSDRVTTSLEQHFLWSELTALSRFLLALSFNNKVNGT